MSSFSRDQNSLKSIKSSMLIAIRKQAGKPALRRAPIVVDLVSVPRAVATGTHHASLIKRSGSDTESEAPHYHSLASIMQSLKGFTAHEGNRLLGRQGAFWAHESYDHYVRDREEWNRIVA